MPLYLFLTISFFVVAGLYTALPPPHNLNQLGVSASISILFKNFIRSEEIKKRAFSGNYWSTDPKCFGQIITSAFCITGNVKRFYYIHSQMFLHWTGKTGIPEINEQFRWTSLSYMNLMRRVQYFYTCRTLDSKTWDNFTFKLN